MISIMEMLACPTSSNGIYVRQTLGLMPPSLVEPNYVQLMTMYERQNKQVAQFPQQYGTILPQYYKSYFQLPLSKVSLDQNIRHIIFLKLLEASSCSVPQHQRTLLLNNLLRGFSLVDARGRKRL